MLIFNKYFKYALINNSFFIIILTIQTCPKCSLFPLNTLITMKNIHFKRNYTHAI